MEFYRDNMIASIKHPYHCTGKGITFSDLTQWVEIFMGVHDTPKSLRQLKRVSPIDYIGLYACVHTWSPHMAFLGWADSAVASSTLYFDNNSCQLQSSSVICRHCWRRLSNHSDLLPLKVTVTIAIRPCGFTFLFLFSWRFSLSQDVLWTFVA